VDDLNLIFQKLGVALGLGLLVGMQRQRAASELAGIRTFPLITVWGALCALLSLKFGGWILAVGAVCVAVIFFAGNLIKLKTSKDAEPGVTTEMAAMLMFGLGAYVVIGQILVAVVVGGGVAVLLQFKRPMHQFVEKIGNEDAMAIMQFVLIALVILPILPNRTYGPYSVFNPFELWTVVVLIVGIGLGSYLCYRLLGDRVGTLLAGVLGGLISSTATTVAYARKTKEQPKVVPLAALVVMIASTIVFARIIVEILFVGPANAMQMVIPIAAMFGLMAVMSTIAYLRVAKNGEHPAPQGNPAQLKGAITFGLIYSAVIFAVAAAKDHLGDSGLYVVSVISGLTDVDALTLSTSQLVKQNRLDPGVAWHLILIGALSNLVFKAGMVASFGAPQLWKYIVPAFAFAVVSGAALILLFNPVTSSLVMR
jgi:uncharacterized membrane protein (DUF4010 family)